MMRHARFTPRDLLAALAVVVIWGLNFVAMKFALHDFTPFQLGAKGLRRGRFGEVVRQHGDLDAMRRAQFDGKGMHPLGATCRQHQVMPQRSELAGEFGSDAGGGAGDQTEWATSHRVRSGQWIVILDHAGRTTPVAGAFAVPSTPR